MSVCRKKLSVKPLVSIITVVYNGEEEIGRTMESVRRQSYGAVEHLVIDGGSTDGTVEAIKRSPTPPDYLVSETDRGISDAFNKGLAAAGGELVAMLNAGDWYETDTVARVVAAFQRQPDADAVCGAVQFWRRGRAEYRCLSVPHLLRREMSVAHPATFLRTELFARVGVFSLEYWYAMDYELLLRLSLAGGEFEVDENVLVNMEHDGVSEANWRQALAETHRARRTHLGTSPFSSSLYYRFLYLKRLLRVRLEEKGFDSLLRLYRERLAMVKKTRK